MAIWQYDLNLSSTDPTSTRDVQADLSAMLPELESWSTEVRIWGEMEGNRVDAVFDDNGCDFLVRFDMREPSIVFIKKILSIARERKLVIRNECGDEVFNCVESVVDGMKKSDAYRFVADPRGFLESISG